MKSDPIQHVVTLIPYNVINHPHERHHGIQQFKCQIHTVPYFPKPFETPKSLDGLFPFEMHTLKDSIRVKKRDKASSSGCLFQLFIRLNTFWFLFASIKNWNQLARQHTHCRGLFFQSTTDQIQHPSDPPEAQSPTTLVIHGRPNMRKMAQKPSTEPKVQKKRTRPSPPVHQIPVYHAREF